MAAIQIFKSTSYLIFLVIILRILVEKRNILEVKSCVFEDSQGLQTDGVHLANYLVSLRPNVKIRRRCLGRNFSLTFAAIKHSKHGSTSLALASKPFMLDLSIYMDIARNPGPNWSYRSGKSMNQDKHVFSCIPSNSTTKLQYSPKVLRTLRMSTKSKVSTLILDTPKTFIYPQIQRKTRWQATEESYYNVQP